MKFAGGDDRMDIELTIDHLILDGIPADVHEQVVAALQAQLSKLLHEEGIPPKLQTGGHIETLDASEIAIPAGAAPDRIGALIAQAIYESFLR